MKIKLALFLALCLPACAQFNFFTALSTWKGTADTNLPILYLPLNEASGNAIATYGPTFQEQGTVGALSPGRGTYSTVNYFDHSDGFAHNLASNSFTVTAWVKSTYFYTNSSAFGPVVISSGTSTNFNFCFTGPYNDGASDIDVTLSLLGSTNEFVGIGIGGVITNVNSWNFIVGQFNQPALTAAVFVNMTDSVTNSIAVQPQTPSNQTFAVGASVSSTNAVPFNGYIQHLRLYPRLLSLTELTNLYNGGVPN